MTMRETREPTAGWDYVGSNRQSKNIPKWVLSAFARMPGSHGTRLIDYPEPGYSIHLRGKTFRYRIDMGERDWYVYRRLRTRRR